MHSNRKKPQKSTRLNKNQNVCVMRCVNSCSNFGKFWFQEWISLWFTRITAVVHFTHTNHSNVKYSSAIVSNENVNYLFQKLCDWRKKKKRGKIKQPLHTHIGHWNVRSCHNCSTRSLNSDSISCINQLRFPKRIFYSHLCECVRVYIGYL